ncbi:hypothetical protein E8E14_009208 [Neopestalotiopsis sp. 37M]|nr:hypothetical protein E8E14_009208 [Neopestalotiopsis sp. 37M]
MQLNNLTTILAIGVSLAMGHVLPSIQDEAPSDKGHDFSTMDERLAPSVTAAWKADNAARADASE